MGEAAQVLVRNPFELIKQNMQIGKYATVTQAIRDIYAKNGITGFYRGYYVTVLREIPFGLVQYPLYEYFKSKKKQEGMFFYSLCGAKAGGIAAFVTTPIDVIKTRIMTAPDKAFDMRHIVQTFRSIYQNEGPLKLFSGVHIRVLYISVGGMMFFGANEFFKSLFVYKYK